MKTIVANVSEAIFKIWFLFLITHSRCEGQPFGGAIRVRMMRKRMNMPTMAPSLLIRSMSVIFTALAERTRKITEILEEERFAWNESLSSSSQPPSFKHKGPIGESKSNLAKPNPKSASDYVGSRVQHYRLKLMLFKSYDDYAKSADDEDVEESNKATFNLSPIMPSRPENQDENALSIGKTWTTAIHVNLGDQISCFEECNIFE